MNKTGVLILSGGIDSTTLCYKYVAEGWSLYPLIFNYGQKHSKEIEFAKRTCSVLGLEHKSIDLSAINELLSGSALTDQGVDIPEVNEDTERFDTLETTIVPNRNSIFLSIAIGYAVSMSIDNVFFGAHHSDRGVYPDCRTEFVDSFQESERLATGNENLRVIAPFVNLTKAQIVKTGSELNVPFENTWSCYAGSEVHCGRCSSCVERKKAFREAGIEDNTSYAARDLRVI